MVDIDKHYDPSYYSSSDGESLRSFDTETTQSVKPSLLSLESYTDDVDNDNQGEQYSHNLVDSRFSYDDEFTYPTTPTALPPLTPPNFVPETPYFDPFSPIQDEDNPRYVPGTPNYLPEFSDNDDDTTFAEDSSTLYTPDTPNYVPEDVCMSTLGDDEETDQDDTLTYVPDTPNYVPEEMTPRYIPYNFSSDVVMDVDSPNLVIEQRSVQRECLYFPPGKVDKQIMELMSTNFNPAEDVAFLQFLGIGTQVIEDYYRDRKSVV